MHAARNPEPRDDGDALRAAPPGRRDLGCPDLWDLSLERSRARRAHAAAQRPRWAQVGSRRALLALTAASLAATPAAASASTGGGAASTSDTGGTDGSAGDATTTPTTGTQLTGATAPQRTSAAQSGAASLAQGAIGAGVKALQKALGLTADGEFGAQTKQAVSAAQTQHGLPATGTVDAATAQALGLPASILAGGSGSSSSSPPASGSTSGVATTAVTLTKAQTKSLQRSLGVDADGAMGSRTRAALKRAERRHGLTPDGRPDAKILKVLGVSTTSAAPTADAASSAQPATGTAPAVGQGAAAAVAAAQSKIGAPYSSGSSGPSSFDCSGLTSWAFKQAGIDIARTSQEQYASGTAVQKSQIQAGDLVFFDTAGPGPSDVGIATGPTTVVSATTHGVMSHAIDDSYWGSHYVGARRMG